MVLYLELDVRYIIFLGVDHHFQMSKETKKATRLETKVDKKPNRGILLVRGLPLGFAEPQLRKWFSQFGKITRVTIARSRISANPRGFGFVEFENEKVAEIVAEKIPRYLMFGKTMHIHMRDKLEKSQAGKLRMRNSSKLLLDR